MTDTFTKEQLEERKLGIGASEAAAICGISPWAGPLDVYLVKTGQAVVEDNENMRRGRVLEPALREWWAQLHPDCQVQQAATVKHPDHDFIYATPDGIVTQGGFDTDVLELKAPASTTNHWGTPGTDQIPAYYIPQVMQQMACTGLHRAKVGALIWGELKSFTVEFDAELWESIADIEHDFWHNHILPRVPPSFDGAQKAADWLKEKYPTANKDLVVATAVGEEAAVKLYAVQCQLKELKAQEKALKATLIQEIGDNYGMETSAGKVLHYNTKGRESVAWKALVGELGGTATDIDRHRTRGKPGRTLRGYWAE